MTMATFVLVRGFWLDASSWRRLVPLLEQRGHRVLLASLPGTGPDDDRSGVRLADHVEAVLDAVRAADEPVVLVGSSFAGRLVTVVAEEHPELVRALVLVDSAPMPLDPGGSDEPAGDEVPFSWDELSEPEQRDLSPALRAEIEQAAVPFPAQVVRDGWDMSRGRRFAVPVTIVASGFDEAQLEQWRHDYPEVADELDGYEQLQIAWLPTSHWPHLTRPDDLAEILVDVVDETSATANG